MRNDGPWTVPEALKKTNGVLTLSLPKVVEARNKVVKINLGGTESPALEATDA